MPYLSLYKQFVKSNNQSEFNGLYLSRYNSESSIHLPLKIHNNDAFIFLHPDLISLLSAIYASNTKVRDVFSKLPDVAKDQYIKKSLIDEVTFTNEIEGVISTRKEINEIITDISEHIKNENRFEGIVSKYRTLLSAESIDITSSSAFRKIYDDILLKEVISNNPKDAPDGVIFRKNTVHVVDGRAVEIHEGINPEKEIIRYMDEALNFLNNYPTDPIIKVAVFHYLVGYIHPFYDGNGRINRFVSSYVLSQHLEKIIGFRLSMTVRENLSKYYNAFKDTNDVRNKGDISTFVYTFLTIVLEALDKTYKYASNKYEEWTHYQDYFKHLEFNHKGTKEVMNILVQAEIFSEYGVTKSNLSSICNISRNTIKVIIDELNSKQLLKVNKIGKRNYYRANINK